MIDENNDNAKSEQLTINIIHGLDGTRIVQFLGLIPLSGQNAHYIFDSLIDFLKNTCKLDFSC